MHNAYDQIPIRCRRRDAMEQVPHWLQVTVFAAGMTAYANEVDAHETAELAPPAPDAAADTGTPDSYH